MSEWYEADDPPADIFWWAIEHRGHAAFYARALMPGDFAPGQRGPLARHVLTLEGDLVRRSPTCGTCGEHPKPEDLEPIERATGQRGHLDVFRRRRAPWPAPTETKACHECSNPRERGRKKTDLEAGFEVEVCDRCDRALKERERHGRDKAGRRPPKRAGDGNGRL